MGLETVVDGSRQIPDLVLDLLKGQTCQFRGNGFSAHVLSTLKRQHGLDFQALGGRPGSHHLSVQRLQIRSV